MAIIASSIADGCIRRNYKNEYDKDVTQHVGDTPANRLPEACSLVSYIEHCQG